MSQISRPFQVLPVLNRSSLRGAFLSFEGIDGCGKSTQALRLVENLREKGLAVHHTREPGGTEIGQKIRALLLHPDHTAMEPQAELLLYLADRLQHLAQDIRPALARGETVICDRFHDATVAYQQYGRGLDFTAVQPLIDREILPTMPVTTFWLDVSVATAQARIASRAGQPPAGDRLEESRLDDESTAFHERVRSGYAQLHHAAQDRIVRLDAEQDMETIHQEILRAVGERHEL